MGRFANWIQTFALTLGAPGLFLIAFLDSSFLSLPEVTDLLLIWMVTQHKSRLVLYAASATIGSIAGCLALYYVGRRGDQFMVRRFGAARVDRTMAIFQRYGVLAVLIPSLLPPPAPFKVFVVLAGVAGISAPRFVTALAIGRGVRYFGEGLLAVWYGDQAVVYLRENGGRISLWVVLFLTVGVAVFAVWRWAKRAGTPVDLRHADD